MSQPQYNHPGATSLSDYFMRLAGKNLSPGARRTYLLLERLERVRCGLGGLITENERTLARQLCASRNTVKAHFRELAADGWIEYLPGQAVLKDGKATSIRRRTVAELKAETKSKKLPDHTPADARAVLDILNSRSFTYGSETVSPHFAAASTGRIYTSQPNPQGNDQQTRLTKARSGVAPGQIACEIDYRQADASIIRTILNKNEQLPAKDWPTDIYDHFGKLIRCSREEAKSQVNRLFYVRQSRAIIERLCPNAPTGDFILRLADSLDVFKTALWQKGKPCGRRPGWVTTLGDTRIEGLSSDCKKAIHQGTLLAWLVQGTVADALNKDMRELIEEESTQGWRVLFPVHDSVVMLCPEGKLNNVQEIMEAKAKALGVPLQTKVVQ